MAQKAQPAHRPQLAAAVTSYKKYMHAQHIVDRFLYGYGWRGTYHYPAMDLVALYVDQQGVGDLTYERAESHPSMKVYPSIEEAVTQGTDKLAVDGVILVGELGNYPFNEKGQEEHPHFRFFEQIVAVYRTSGRSVPMFNDKQLSWKWDWAKQMYDTSQQMGFAFQGGSSLPVTWRIPSIEMPWGASIREALCICYGGVGSYDFHGLETIQCMVERRRGGETGVEWLEAYRGDSFWKAHEKEVWSRDLFRAALARSHTLSPGRAGFTNVFPTVDEMRVLAKDPVAYHYQHADGLRSTMILMDGLVLDFNFAATVEGQSKPFSTQMYLPMPDGRTTLADFFNPLVYNMELMFLTGKAQYPIERTLLTSGLVIAGIDSLFNGQQRIPTPHLAIRYQPRRESTFERF
ncbi:MAG: hypothetical protein ACRD2B_02170 [Terriglobia bacterium]